ncbi:GNAT family N-acetyltransferase [Paenibacillus fonticola]|uniref:GNAT family N-acetyltransferase n=1 Tax=Paenibacillus fonticola TaxID=379896 RepID=UPI0003681B27|nr:GNAT family N-acetyltransferase [Paenibacillus fonticola]
MLKIEKAQNTDAQRLTEIQKASFDEEARQFNHNQPGGPPGYDSEDWQIDMMNHGHYFKIVLDDVIVGGAIIFIDGNQIHNLGRIYIDPQYQNQGIGTQAMQEIEQKFEGARKWWLDTPCWSLRNHHFYSKCGYTKVNEADGQFIFEKY